MNTLWTFGCSFTNCEGCKPGDEYYEKYRNEGDKIWPELVAENYGMVLQNFGINGASNDVILDNLIEQYNNIKKNDIVILGFTLPHRFDIPYKNKFTSVFNYFLETEKNEVLSYYTEEQLETIINFQYHFSYSNLFRKRQLMRFNFFIELLKEKGIKICFWRLLEETEKKFERIYNHTKNNINDGHFSYNGHIEFSKYIISKLEPKDKFI